MADCRSLLLIDPINFGRHLHADARIDSFVENESNGRIICDAFSMYGMNISLVSSIITFSMCIAISASSVALVFISNRFSLNSVCSSSTVFISLKIEGNTYGKYSAKSFCRIKQILCQAASRYYF